MFWKNVLFFWFGCDLQNEHNLFVVENVFIDAFVVCQTGENIENVFRKAYSIKMNKDN